MCRHCENSRDVITNFETDIGKIELFIEENSNILTINSFETEEYGYDDLVVCDGVKINYCPMCGRKL